MTLKGKTVKGRSSAALLISGLLLVAVILQATPFVIPLPSSLDCPAEGVGQYFEPLQVCNDFQGPGALLNDIPWIPPSPEGISSTAEAMPFFATVSQVSREGFSLSPYRPPRPLSPTS